ncbi:ureidoglycolate lyase [Tahibacter amnicola]|uniref:Ureidoglycolate lyase n=1 Tax=Tahibacter amnicola TaxID=2976241 RepID=A0ABY6BGN9_9GAMM|nr:ureidoglycolate lyase [Tahibacter amnicola]UXI68677.1 ureidoglycolate lyase [Tahibacter amnicola]
MSNPRPDDVLALEPLTAAAFAAFGDVIEPASARQVYAVNDGTAQRFHDLARVDTGTGDGHPLISIFRAEPRTLPMPLRCVERHPLGSQAFVPLSRTPFIVVVTADPHTRPRAFLSQNGQGVNYHRGTWHHPLIALEQVSDFLVIDRGGPGDNCEEVALRHRWMLPGAGELLLPPAA